MTFKNWMCTVLGVAAILGLMALSYVAGALISLAR